MRRMRFLGVALWWGLSEGGAGLEERSILPVVVEASSLDSGSDLCGFPGSRCRLASITVGENIVPVAAFAGELFVRDKVLDSIGVKDQNKKNDGSG